VGLAVGAGENVGDSVGLVGLSVGDVGDAVGLVGLSVGDVGDAVGLVGLSVGDVGDAVGVEVGASVGQVTPVRVVARLGCVEVAPWASSQLSPVPAWRVLWV
jgi:hypothetical protein